METIEINGTEIFIDYVEINCANPAHADTTSRWIEATATIYTERGSVDDIKLGCWDDTDDDEAEWSETKEGAKVLLSLMLGKDTKHDGTETGPIYDLMAEECEQVGQWVCNVLRNHLIGDGATDAISEGVIVPDKSDEFDWVDAAGGKWTCDVHVARVNGGTLAWSKSDESGIDDVCFFGNADIEAVLASHMSEVAHAVPGDVVDSEAA